MQESRSYDGSTYGRIWAHSGHWWGVARRSLPNFLQQPAACLCVCKLSLRYATNPKVERTDSVTCSRPKSSMSKSSTCRPCIRWVFMRGIYVTMQRERAWDTDIPGVARWRRSSIPTTSVKASNTTPEPAVRASAESADKELGLSRRARWPIRCCRRTLHGPRAAPMDDRACIAGILFVPKTGIAWDDLPAEMGCGSVVTCWSLLHSAAFC